MTRIFDITGSLLIILSAGYFVVFRRYWIFAAALLIPLFVLWQPGPAAPVSKLMSNGTRVTQIAQRESFYGNVKVLDYDYGKNRTREMVIDGLVQGGINRNTGLSIYPYNYFLQFIPYALYPEGSTCLVIGLGAGLVPKWYEQQGVDTYVVDIDPAVVELAESYFNFNGRGKVTIHDARYFLNTSSNVYDFVIMDVFNGDTTPGYLLSLEALRLLAGRMSQQAVLGINLVGSLTREPFMTASVVRTLGAVFDQVEIYPTFDPARGDGFGNITVIAYHGTSRDIDWRSMRRNAVDGFAYSQVWSVMGRRFQFPEGTPAIMLTDNYNPIDFHDAWLRETVRRRIIESTDWDMLL